jgi:hypothetical protein
MSQGLIDGSLAVEIEGATDGTKPGTCCRHCGILGQCLAPEKAKYRSVHVEECDVGAIESGGAKSQALVKRASSGDIGDAERDEREMLRNRARRLDHLSILSSPADASR